MPLYVYECEGCHSRVEKIRAGEDRDIPVKCGTCGGTCHPCITVPGRFQRGNGWKARMGGASMPGKI